MKAWLLGTVMLVVPAMLIIWCMRQQPADPPSIVLSQREPVGVATPPPSMAKDGTAWNLRVDRIKKPDRYSDTRRVQAIGGDLPGDRTWNCSEDEAIAEIRSGEHAFFTNRGGRTAKLVVATSRSGMPYLRTESDGEGLNNLLSLPEIEPDTPNPGSPAAEDSEHENAVNASWSRAAIKYPEVGKEGSPIYHFVQEKIGVVYKADPTFFQKSNWPELIIANLAPQLDSLRTAPIQNAATHEDAVQASWARVAKTCPEAGQPGSALHAALEGSITAIYQSNPRFFDAPNWPEQLVPAVLAEQQPTRKKSFREELRERDRTQEVAADQRRAKANAATQANFHAYQEQLRQQAANAQSQADVDGLQRQVRDLQNQQWQTQKQRGGLQIQLH